MAAQKVNFLSVQVDTYSMKQTVEAIDECIQSGGNIRQADINACKMVMMQEDRMMYDSVVNCDLISPDGQSVVWASRILGNPLTERISGIDLMENLVSLAAQKHYTCFFFGAREEVVKKMVEIYSEKYSPAIIAGYRNGYFDDAEAENIAKQISNSHANMLFVAITSPKKEIFLNKYRDILQNVNYAMGVGGSFDVIAGFMRRAPLWMQKTGLEWFFRLIQEPRRMWRRYLIGNLQFAGLVIRELFRKGR